MSQSPRIPYPETERPVGGLNVEHMFAHMPPDLHAGFLGFAMAVMASPALDPLLRELAILRVGHLSNSAYELHQHSAYARYLGMPDAKVAAAATGAAATVFDARERAVLNFVDDLVLRVRPSDAALAGIREHLDLPGIFAVILATGQYMMVCRILETTGVPIEDDADLAVNRLSSRYEDEGYSGTAFSAAR